MRPSVPRSRSRRQGRLSAGSRPPPLHPCRRRWREETPNVDYDLLEVAGTPTACRAVAQVSGDFPGSPVTLRFAFERDVRGKITVLTITP